MSESIQCELPLWEHQKTMVKRCLEIDSTCSVGLLTDKAGTGKTHVAISMIAQTLRPTKSPCSTNIIVVTENIYRQWWDSFTLYPGLTYQKFTSYEEITRLYFNTSILTQYNILLTTPLYYNTIAQIITSEGLRVHRLIIDEIDSVSGIMQSPLSADTLWFISASFHINATGCYKRQIEEYEPLEQITCRCQDHEYQILTDLEEPDYQTHLCKDIYLDLLLDGIITSEEESALNALSFDDIHMEHVSNQNISNINEAVQRLREEMMRKRHSLQADLEEVDRQLKQLGEDIDNVISDKEYTVQLQLERKDEQFQYHLPEENDRTALQEKVSVLHTRKRQIHNKSAMNQEKIDKINQRLKESKLCMVCQEALTPESRICATSCCQSIYCFHCISTWLVDNNNHSCPYCRSGLEINLFGKKTNTSSSNNSTAKVFVIGNEEEHEKFIQETSESLLTQKQKCTEELKEMDTDCIEQERELETTMREREATMKKRAKEKAKQRFEWIKQQQEDYEESTQDQLSKLETIRNLIQNITPEDRVIIFSNYSQTFRQICGILEEFEYSHVTLDGGNMKDLESALDQYRSGEVQIIMADSGMHGCGINLECTSQIILVHRVDGATRTQLIARAQRPGRHGRLVVHQLSHRSE